MHEVACSICAAPSTQALNPQKHGVLSVCGGCREEDDGQLEESGHGRGNGEPLPRDAGSLQGHASIPRPVGDLLQRRDAGRLRESVAVDGAPQGPGSRYPLKEPETGDAIEKRLAELRDKEGERAVNSALLRAPFPYFGGKRTIAETVWRAFGRPKQYIEPFCGSAAVLLSAREPVSLEVIGDANGFIANFWRAVVAQAEEVARWADYPVSHIDLGARHMWMMGERERLGASLQDPNWPGDAKLAGWWLWGQCSWIGSGWCDWTGKVPHVSSAGMGIQATGQVPHVSSAGMGSYDPWTSSGRVAMRWLRELASRMERVRVVHGSWDRCLNSHYGAGLTAIFLDPPYKSYEKLYGVSEPVAGECEAWAKDNAGLRVALCGHRGDYDMPGWIEHEWDRGRLTYNGGTTTAKECIWFSPACLPLRAAQASLFDRLMP